MPSHSIEIYHICMKSWTEKISFAPPVRQADFILKNGIVR